MTVTATPPTPIPATEGSSSTTSRRAARTSGAPSAWPRVLAGIHAQGTSLRVVVARQDAADAAPVVVEYLTVPSSDAGALTSFLLKHKVSDAVRLIPSSATVGRCVSCPNGLSTDRAQAASTLALLAESEMPSMIPAHRRAAGVIHPGADTSIEAVLVVGWPQRNANDGAMVGGASVLPVRSASWTPELVALAALAESMGGAELALYADRQPGSVAIIATGAGRPASGVNGSAVPATAGKVVARVLRGDTGSETAWRAFVQRTVAETAASVGIPPSLVEIVENEPASLVLLGSPMRRARGVPSEPGWLSGYGIAYGAVAALAHAEPTSSPLALLRSDAPRESAGPVVRTVEYLAKPRRTAVAVAICLLVLLLWPLAVAKTREMVLARRAGGSEGLQQRLKEAERRVAFYQQLRNKRWPMTKLIADISGAAPVGVHIDALSLSPEQGVDVRGRAQKPEQVTDFRTNLTTSGIFGSVATPTVETESGAITFQLKADIVAPQYAWPRAGDFDFVKTPLAVHLYGERARGGASSSSSTAASTPSTTPAPRPESPDDSSRAARSSSSTAPAPRTGLREAGGNREDGAAGSGGSRRPAATASAIPEPLTDAQIAAMDSKTAMSEWATRKKASTIADLDAAVKQRLLDEAEKCRARMVAARG